LVSFEVWSGVECPNFQDADLAGSYFRQQKFEERRDYGSSAVLDVVSVAMQVAG
jgi:hypothetical protein